MRPWHFILTSLMLCTCKKDDLQLLISGIVEDPNQQIAVAGAHVVLTGQVLEGGSFNNNFNQLATATTNANGQFSMEFERKTVANYRIQVEREGYLNNQIEFSGDQVRPDETYNTTVQILPEAWSKVRLSNQNPFDEEDRLAFRYVDATLACACCDEQTVVLFGMNADSSWTCKYQGAYWMHYWYQTERDGIVQSFGDSIFLAPHDTTSILLEL